MLQDLATKNVIKRNKKVLKSKFKMKQQYLYTSSERKIAEAVCPKCKAVDSFDDD